TPALLSKNADLHGMQLVAVIYWHLHPYLPRYEPAFPHIFNAMSYYMTPLGRTPVGALIGSSFLVILKKK
ncbi:MAG: hypothetical protein G01um101466_731, partial [Parcubacteria group bacterium Gr01-1014_66]